MLGVFLVLPFIRLGHDRQDLYCPCDRVHVLTGSASVYARSLRSVQILVCGKAVVVGCLTSQQQASVSQGRICSDIFNVLPH